MLINWETESLSLAKYHFLGWLWLKFIKMTRNVRFCLLPCYSTEKIATQSITISIKTWIIFSNFLYWMDEIISNVIVHTFNINLFVKVILHWWQTMSCNEVTHSLIQIITNYPEVVKARCAILLEEIQVVLIVDWSEQENPNQI